MFENPVNTFVNVGDTVIIFINKHRGNVYIFLEVQDFHSISDTKVCHIIEILSPQRQKTC